MNGSVANDDRAFRDRGVSVVLPTGLRRETLSRALESVFKQDYDGPIEALLIISDQSQPAARHFRFSIAKYADFIRIIDVGRELSARRITREFRSARVAWMRNAGSQAARGRYVAFLDDDNEYEAEHLRTLVKTVASTGVEAVHSWRQLLSRDGQPFIGDQYPWLKGAHDPDRSRYVYDELVAVGILARGSNVMRDAMTGLAGQEILSVDSSEWLMTKTFALRHGFPVDYTFRQVSHDVAEDFEYCRRLEAIGVRPECSRLATLRYYLGGDSTRWMLT